MIRQVAPSRREFLGAGMAGAAFVTFGGVRATAEKPRPLKAVFESYIDDRTGARVYRLTSGESKDGTFYQTHPMWTPGMRYFVFNSNRSGSGSRPHAIDMAKGIVSPLVEGPCGNPTMTWLSGELYYLVGREVFCMDVAGGCKETVAPKRIGVLPEECVELSGSTTVDGDESTLYVGGVIEPEKTWGIFAIDVKTGSSRTVVRLDFRVGHTQANPHRPGELMFCHETGGDAPQRTWFVRADGTGLKPLYKETYGEWVTHEVWWGPDKVIFTIWPYDDDHKKQPHGVAVTDKKTGPEGKMKILNQYAAWHTHGSPDFRWAMGDDFDRNIWLIDSKTSERRLLTSGHCGEGFKTHPHGSFTPDSRNIVFNSSRFGKEDILMAEIPDWDSLPKSKNEA